mmetsp:Transcript_2649/g.11287  ORF Transcript_2649/g.11287 Transcript_2649/m.11287 type:complete len:440 (+) Transcript_2649:430-1749(+)
MSPDGFFVVILVCVPNPAAQTRPFFSASAVLSNTKHLIEEGLVDPLSVPNLLVCGRSPRLTLASRASFASRPCHSSSRGGGGGGVGHRGEVVRARARRQLGGFVVVVAAAVDAERRRVLRLGVALDPTVQLQQRQARELVLQTPVEALARPRAVPRPAAARAPAKLVPPSLDASAQRVRARVGPGGERFAAHVGIVPVQEEPGDGRRGEVLLRGVLRGGGHLGGGGDGGAERVDVVALAQSLLRRRGGDRRGDHRRVHRGGGDVGGGGLGEELASQRNVLFDAEAVLEAVPELALGIRRPEEDVAPGAERRARHRVLVLALAPGAVEVHDGEGVVRVGGPGDGGAREERGAASAPSRSELGGFAAGDVAAVKVDAAHEEGGEDAAGVDRGFGKGGRALVPVPGGRPRQDLLADVRERALAHSRVSEALGREHCVEILRR